MKNEQLSTTDIQLKQPPVLFAKTQSVIAELARRAASCWHTTSATRLWRSRSQWP
jgi:hypothetical protein